MMNCYVFFLSGVEISLQRTSYTVAERPGAIVSVCTRVVGSNRVEIPVSLRLSTVRDTAGTSLLMYTTVNIDLIFLLFL